MAKRRTEHTLQHDSPLKRYRRAVRSVDVQLESMTATAGRVPSILALLGGRSRKRAHRCDDVDISEEESAPYLQTILCYSKRRTAYACAEPLSGSFQDRRSSCPVTSKKRPREDGLASDTAIPALNEKSEADEHKEDCTYNSFQYWRVPLPELDLSLLDEADDLSQIQGKSKVCDASSDAMET